MQGSKIRLSPSEASLIGNTEVILTKNSIIQKTVALFAGLQQEMVSREGVRKFPSSPKISKGENYLGLPYVVLDYPRISKGEDLCFIRTMFWWGHFFSTTLQLAGHYKEVNLPLLSEVFDTFSSEEYYISISEDPWQHHFEASNYQKLSTLTKAEYLNLLQQQPHIKIAARYPLSAWDAAANQLYVRWRMLADLIA